MQPRAPGSSATRFVSGSTAYKPGQFTRLCGNEGKPVGNFYFAGEHANSFYWWQGFMEGAALSGKDAAAAILPSPLGMRGSRLNPPVTSRTEGARWAGGQASASPRTVSRRVSVPSIASI